MRTQIFFIMVFPIISSLLGCVSLDISPKVTASKSIIFKAPNKFETTDIENLDASWIDKQTGNSISLKSSCYDPADPSLADLETSALNGLFVVDKIDSKKMEFNQREALRSKTLVKIDGIKVIIEMLIFKKNNCNYLINHLGLEKSFSKTSERFESFVNSVEVR